jgi:hypothetical protein
MEGHSQQKTMRTQLTNLRTGRARKPLYLRVEEPRQANAIAKWAMCENWQHRVLHAVLGSDSVIHSYVMHMNMMYYAAEPKNSNLLYQKLLWTFMENCTQILKDFPQKLCSNSVKKIRGCIAKSMQLRGLPENKVQPPKTEDTSLYSVG